MENPFNYLQFATKCRIAVGLNEEKMGRFGCERKRRFAKLSCIERKVRMKKIIIVLGALAVVAAVAVFAWIKVCGSSDDIPIKMGTFESTPPSEKGFKLDDMNIKFDGKAPAKKAAADKQTPADKNVPSAKKGE